MSYLLVSSLRQRGGGRPVLSLNAEAAAERYRLEAMDDRSPDKLFERAWALTILDQVLARLEQEFVLAGKAPLFQQLRDYLVVGIGEETYAKVAAEMGMTSEAVKKAVHRLRRRYHKLFREEIARTVEDASSVEDELRYLCEVMAR